MNIACTRRRILALASTCVGLVHRASAQSAWLPATVESSVELGHGATCERFTVNGRDDNVDFHIVRFDASQCTLRIVDQPDPTAPLSLGAVMPQVGAIAGVNGGFFDPKFQPLGLMICSGKKTGSWQKSSLLGGVIQVKQGHTRILWRDEFQSSAGLSDLLQTGPRLVNNGAAITGLEVRSSRPRSFVATDNAGHWVIGICHYISLGGLAQLLATPGTIPGLKVVRALNFDGGKSTGLWALPTTGPSIYEREITRVRNFVAVVPR
jgi:uncharacterized protein YigE (DUF2233 family)